MQWRRDEALQDNGFEAWGGYMQAKITKLEEQIGARAANERKSDLFRGISIYVNGYTKPSADELKMLMSSHGGVYHTYERSEDFVIASNLPDTKVKRLTMAKVVRPEWITESLDAGCLLDYKNYLLYSRHTRTQPKLHFDTIKANTTPVTNNHTDLNYEKEQAKNNSTLIEISKSDIVKPNSVDFDPKKERVSTSHDNTRKELMYSDAERKYSSDIPLNEVVPSIVLEGGDKSEIEKDISSSRKQDSDTRSNNIASSLNHNKEQLLRTSETESINQIARQSDCARTAVDPKFLSEFYNNSRLHHISQLGAGFKQYVNELRDASDFKFPARCQLKDMINSMTINTESPIRSNSFKGSKVIMHIDMDCFFVSVGLRNRPELRGQPVAVTHAKNTQHRAQKRIGENREAEFNLYRQKKAKALAKATGISEYSLLEDNMIKTRLDDLDQEEEDGFSSLSEIASCSYEARAKGIRNGMFMGAALKLCPDLKTIPYSFDGYKEVAYTLYNTVSQYTLDIEAVSCDEMYVDCGELMESLDISAEQFASALRREIRSKTGCPCSTGFGGNRLQARLATKRAKPDGQFFLVSHLVDNFMLDVKLEDLPGVGRQLQMRLAAVCGDDGATCRALRPHSLASLQKHLGTSAGRQLYYYCRGDDQRPLAFVTVRKSVSAEVNYGIRFENQTQCDTFLKQLCCEVHDRMKSFKVTGKSITLKVMIRAKDAPIETAKFMGHGFCDSINRTATLQMATDDLVIITREVLQLCKKQKYDPKEMRGIGIQVTKLESTVQREKKNAIDAFLVRPETKASSSNYREIEFKSVVTTTEDYSHNFIESCNERETCKTEKEFKQEVNVGSWLLRVQPKRSIEVDNENLNKTPEKCTPMRSPVVLKRSPGKSPQKTPPKKKCLGLTGRRRGRPPKQAGNTHSVPTASKVLMDKFLTGETTRAEANTIDPEILAALPEDIRKEVLEHYQITVPSGEYSRPNTPQGEVQEFQKVVSTTAQKEPDVMMDIFEVPWQQVRAMLRAWLAAGRMPVPCDVDLMSTYMQHMVIRRDIHNLIILVNFLRRTINDMEDAGWSRVYVHITEGIQQTMLAVYGKRLLID